MKIVHITHTHNDQNDLKKNKYIYIKILAAKFFDFDSGEYQSDFGF